MLPIMIVIVDIVNCGNNDGCHPNASCVDMNGSYTCTCKNGFTGDGFSCHGIYIIFDLVLMFSSFKTKQSLNVRYNFS